MQRKDVSAWSLIVLSVMFGSIATTTVAGCKPKTAKEVDTDLGFEVEDGTVDTNVTATAEAPAATETPAATAAPASEAAEPAASAAPAASTEPAGEMKPVAEKAMEPGDSKVEAAAAVAAVTTEAVAAASADKKPMVDKQPAAEEAAKSEAAKADVAADSARDDIGKVEDPNAVMEAGGDWPQWGGTRWRNNAPNVTGLPDTWKPGKFDRKTGEWDKSKSENIRWVSKLGSQTYGNPVIANGQVYVGTNNSSGHVARYPYDVDLGVLLCFDEKNGDFLWQHSSEKLITGRVHDWPLQGVCSAPLVEGDRLWFVTSRGEVRCVDTKGFHDGKDDGMVEKDVRVADVEAANPAYKETVAKLDEGQLTDALKDLLTKHGEELSGDAEVKAVAAGKSWTIAGKFSGTDRVLNAKVIGPRLTVSKDLGVSDTREADVIWVYDMMKTLGSSQHNMCSCSITALGDLLFVGTGNGHDESHINLPAPNAPSFFCMDKNTAEVYWTDKSPGENILHGQWSSPTVAELGGVPQVLFGGGDGYLYSFRADKGQDGKPELLWYFDANPKESEWILGGEATRNNLIGTPVAYKDLVYIAVGEDPEHGEGDGHLYCIDPTKRGDVSPQLAMKVEEGKRVPIPHRREKAVDPKLGEVAVDNPNSAVVWHYSAFDQNEDGEIAFEEQMHRTIGTVAIKDDLLYVADLSGLIHCLDTKGKGDGQPLVYYTFDMLAQSWGTPLIADGRMFMGDEDGDISVFELGAENKEPIEEINMGTSIYSTPVAANGTIYISTKDKLFAIADLSKDEK